MIGYALRRLLPWLIIAGLAALTASHGWVYYQGKQSVYEWLEKERDKVVKDGKDIDDRVSKKGDRELCHALGGCG